MAKGVEIKQFVGALNLDDPIEVLGKGFHRDARGIVWEGAPPNRRGRVVNGNVVVTSTLLPDTGVNKTIAEKYDSITKRIYYLNYNSAGRHGIYCYNTIATTFERLVEVGVNTNGDPLAFTAESHTNIDIIYGDSTQGNILYYVDSLGRPTKINIERALTGGYGSIKRSYLDVAKEPADILCSVAYEHDAANRVNNLRKKLFRIKTRWPFDDQDKSITSSQTLMPIPFNAFDQATDSDPTKNCRLAIVYQTGPANVRKVEILGSNSTGNLMSDFYLIASIDKDAEGISDNDYATYLFYNDKGYDLIDLSESIQLQDYVPQTCEAQTLLNGNVLSYGNITEGYPNLTNFGDGTNTSNIATGEVVSYNSNYYAILTAIQDNKSGFSVGNIHIVVRGIVLSISPSLDTYYVYLTDGSNISYTLSASDDAAAVIEGLRVNALANGYTIISAGNNDLYVFKLGVSLARTEIVSPDGFAYNGLLNTSFNAYDWLSRHGFGLVYRDPKGRTNGVVYTSGFSVQSAAFSETSQGPNISSFLATIYHQPPAWAYDFQWVRTKDLSKLTFVEWITDRTFKDLVVVSGVVKYAYMSIESLAAFGRNNPGSPLLYGFTPGDRVKFVKRYNANGSTANLYGDTKDYEVVGSLINPTINGAVKQGQFVKIILPATDGTFDFGVNGYDNYYIELYTPAQPVASGLNIYFEFGERYAVGDPGIGTRFHQGMLQNQEYLVQPALFRFTKGDCYIKNRSIQTGNIFKWSIPEASGNGFRFLVPLNFIESTYTDSNITPHSVAFAGVGNTFDPTTDSRWLVQVGAAVTTFKVGGVISINFSTARSGDTWIIYAVDKSNDHYVLAGPFDASAAGTYSFPITSVDFNGAVSDSIVLENDDLFLVAECVNNHSDRQTRFLASQFTLTIDHVINDKFIDPNFSDYYPSAVNSNGRPWLFDANANQVNYPNLYRWSLAYQTNTDINQTCRFYPTNFDETNRRYGAIKKMAQLDNELVFFLERKIGHTGVYQKAISPSEGGNILTTTDSIITSNNIQYYQGDIGVGNQPTSVVQSDFVFYGVDPVKNIIWRLSRDGITDLTETYKVKSWGFQNLPKYLNPGNYPFGGQQKVLGTYNIRPDNVGEYLLLAQGTSTPGETFAFEERYNSFTSKYDIDCDCIVCAENIMYYFKNGVLWKQTMISSAHNVFFGTQYIASILIPFNDRMTEKKVFMALAYQATTPWSSNTAADIETDTINSQTFLKQQSRIMIQDYNVLEAPNMYCAFNRDTNSMTNQNLALWEGDYLCGTYILIRLRHPSNGTNYLFAPTVTYTVDPRNH